MSSAADQVAALENETAQAVSLIQVAENAAENAINSANELITREKINAAEIISEVKYSVENAETEIKCLKMELTETKAALAEMKTMVAELKALATLTRESAPLNPAPEQLNVDVDDPQNPVEVIPESVPAIPQSAKKRHRLL